MTEQTPSGGPVDIRTEARGPHWVSWICGADAKPIDSIVLVAASREEAEARARRWAQRLGHVTR